MSPKPVWFLLGLVTLTTRQLWASQPSCSPTSSSTRWIPDRALDDWAPSPNSPLVLHVLEGSDRLTCLLNCSLLTSCMSAVLVEAQCLLGARPLSTPDVESGDLEPRPGARLFNYLSQLRCGYAPGYVHYWEVERCLKFHRGPLGWEAARLVCLQEGGDLALAQTARVRGLIHSLHSTGQAVWAGARCEGGAKLWLDATTVEPGAVFMAEGGCENLRGAVWTSSHVRYFNGQYERPFICQI